MNTLSWLISLVSQMGNIIVVEVTPFEDKEATTINIVINLLAIVCRKLWSRTHCMKNPKPILFVVILLYLTQNRPQKLMCFDMMVSWSSSVKTHRLYIGPGPTFSSLYWSFRTRCIKVPRINTLLYWWRSMVAPLRHVHLPWISKSNFSRPEDLQFLM